MKLVFLLEEKSMKTLLDELLPRILPDVDYLTLSFDGKRNLKKKLPGKLCNWLEPEVRFVIVQDQDNTNCIALKQELSALCNKFTSKPFIIRIACQEMEAWYFGDLKALAKAYGKPDLPKLAEREKYRIPDNIQSPKEELHRLIPEHKQIEGARRVAPYMDIDCNTSHSFHVFVDGVRQLVLESGMP